MTLPLISHPNADAPAHNYPQTALSDRGHLLLSAHSTAVADRAMRLYGRQAADERAALKTAALLHDFGKATPQFQSHVRGSYDGPDKEKNHARLGALATWYVLGQCDVPARDRLAATLAVARHHQALPNAASYTAETLAEAVEGTETAINAQVTAISEAWPERATTFLQQTPATDIEWAGFAEWALSDAPAEELRDVSSRNILTGHTPDSAVLPEQLYDRTLHCWSALTLADKTHAMDVPEEHVFDLETLDKQTIERYVASLREDPPEDDRMAALNNERERARQQAVRGVHEWLGNDDSASSIATLTLPTGLGKTFTGLSAAFEARDILAVDADAAGERPIVYALPYTSIIEQTREIFEDPELWGADPQTSALTVHHYLSETVVRHDRHDHGDVDDTDAGDTTEETAHLLGEAWRDGTILTTFVQLFESLTGPTNRQGLKLPALESGLVVLDEPQALPKDWWDGVVRLLELLTEEYGARVIAMTATQPTLVRNLDTMSLLEAGHAHDTGGCSGCRDGPANTDMLPPAAPETYFETTERVRYWIHESALSHQRGVEKTHVSHETAAARLLEAAKPTGSALAICNTIESSRELTAAASKHPSVTHLGAAIANALDEVDINAANPLADPAKIVTYVLDDLDLVPGNGHKRNLSEGATTYLLTLNSRYRPFDRRVIIELADRLSTAEQPFALASTQAIEAGVDLSFETVFRDIAPLDSIVQAAGRCNRSYEWGPNGGTVHVWTLADPNEETPTDPSLDPPAYYVYEQSATDGGVRGHLRIISDVLADIGTTDRISDPVFARDAVSRYFEQLGEKSLSAGEIRANIDDAKGRWLARQSLIGGRETVDVLVGQTDSERASIDTTTTLFTDGDPTAYDRLQAAAGIRVSVPADVIKSAPTVSRIDAKERESDGVNVFRFTDSGGLRYNLEDGGLQAVEDDISGRFTV